MGLGFMGFPGAGFLACMGLGLWGFRVLGLGPDPGHI